MRSATENVAGFVGFGAAADIARKESAEETPCLIPNILGHSTRRLPGHLSIGVRGQEREVGKLLAVLDAAGVSISAGSACSAHHSGEPSGVLLAMAFDDECARGLLRLSLRRFNTQQEVERFLKILPGAVATSSALMFPRSLRAQSMNLPALLVKV